MRGDDKTNALYEPMRGRFSRKKGQANGYRYDGYFRAEQELLFEHLNLDAETILDACCGSGIMLLPMLDEKRIVFGVDFNQQACAAAIDNGFPIIHGDVFHMPLADCSVDEIVNCQFFNQQTDAGVRSFVEEALRVLAPNGRLILVWRNGNAAIHKYAHAVLSVVDRLRGQPVFPQHTHQISDVESEIVRLGGVVEYCGVHFAPTRWRSRDIDSVLARIFGASNVIVGRKPK